MRFSLEMTLLAHEKRVLKNPRSSTSPLRKSRPFLAMQ
jgi:hypothetical protein